MILVILSGTAKSSQILYIGNIKSSSKMGGFGLDNALKTVESMNNYSKYFRIAH
jgi:hypothetical protein